MDLLDIPVTLVIKAPNQKIADQRVEADLDWTIRKLKNHLSTVYPSQPKEHQQKIIYSGKLLQDEMQLKDILRQIENERIHTVHLVCSTPEFLGSSCTMSSNNTQSEGLRHRHTTAAAPADAHTPAASSNTTQPSSQERSLPSHGAPTQPSLDTSAAFNPQQTYMSQMAAMPTMMPGYPYSPEQMLWLQQMYTQQMAQYMQYYQGIAQQLPVTEPTDQPGANQPHIQLANQVPERNQQMVMNAAGEAVMDNDDDDGDMNRDWLDWLYTISRFGVLLSIVYFYSTISRFLIVVSFFLFMYLYQTGWFRINRNEHAAREQARAREEEAQNVENARREVADGEISEEQTNSDNTDNTEAPPPEPTRPSILQVAFMFCVTFFTSLIPSPPPAVNAN